MNSIEQYTFVSIWIDLLCLNVNTGIGFISFRSREAGSTGSRYGRLEMTPGGRRCTLADGGNRWPVALLDTPGGGGLFHESSGKAKRRGSIGIAGGHCRQ